MVRPEKGPGMFVWFDPDREEVQLYDLEPPMDSGVLEYSEGDALDGSGDPHSLTRGSQWELSF